MEITFDADSDVDFLPDAVTVRAVGSQTFVPAVVCYYFDTISLEMPENLPPGPYEIVIHGDRIFEIATGCVLELEGEGVVENTLTFTEVVALPGDINQDMSVNFDDLVDFVGEWIAQPIEPNWIHGDFDDEQTTGFNDLLILLYNY